MTMVLAALFVLNVVFAIFQAIAAFCQWYSGDSAEAERTMLYAWLSMLSAGVLVR